MGFIRKERHQEKKDYSSQTKQQGSASEKIHVGLTKLGRFGKKGGKKRGKGSVKKS